MSQDSETWGPALPRTSRGSPLGEGQAWERAVVQAQLPVSAAGTGATLQLSAPLLFAEAWQTGERGWPRKDVPEGPVSEDTAPSHRGNVDSRSTSGRPGARPLTSCSGGWAVCFLRSVLTYKSAPGRILKLSRSVRLENSGPKMTTGLLQTSEGSPGHWGSPEALPGDPAQQRGSLGPRRGPGLLLTAVFHHGQVLCMQMVAPGLLSRLPPWPPASVG